MDKALEVAKEIEQIALEHNISVQDLIEQYKKAYSLTDQSIKNKHDTKTNLIITNKEDIDNGEIYDIETGETIREL